MATQSDRAALRRLVALVLGTLVIGACAAGPGPELVALAPTAIPAPTAVPEPTPTPLPLPTPTPEAEVLSEVEEKDPEVQMWAVVDSVTSLNMRADPTTSAVIVAILGPGESGLAGTGETATANGFDWVEIAADGERPAGWAAVDFLVAEDG